MLKGRSNGRVMTARCAVLASAVALSACTGSNKPYQIEIMPAPDVYEEGGIDPFVDATPIDEMPYDGVLYATDRLPAGDGGLERFYANERGGVLRMGVAQVELGRDDLSWEDARRISILKSGVDKYPIRVSGVREIGILDRSATPLLPPGTLGPDPHRAAKVFADKVNGKLARSKRKHIYVYVHGYKVIFENPILVATELWHYLGYDGVFIAYAWPSTPSKWAYLKDIETAAGFARNLRVFLEYLAEETEAEQIHVLGYSAGTRLVARAFEQLALVHNESTPEEIHAELRIGHLILVGSDLDRQIFGAYMADGLLEVPLRASVYLSEKDKALGMSRFLTRRERLGQMWGAGRPPAHLEDYLNEHEAETSVINVTSAEGSTAGNGHAYFRNSPWVSSDILMGLRYDLRPAGRGLVRVEEGSPIFTFPPDYIRRLKEAIFQASPELDRHRGAHFPSDRENGARNDPLPRLVSPPDNGQ